jgi:hypothetical protein
VGRVPPARHVRFLPFILTGAVLGFVLGAVIALTGWFQDPSPTVASNYAPTAGVGYLGLLGAVLLGLVAAVVAILVDRRSERP